MILMEDDDFEWPAPPPPLELTFLEDDEAEWLPPPPLFEENSVILPPPPEFQDENILDVILPPPPEFQDNNGIAAIPQSLPEYHDFQSENHIKFEEQHNGADQTLETRIEGSQDVINAQTTSPTPAILAAPRETPLDQTGSFSECTPPSPLNYHSGAQPCLATVTVPSRKPPELTVPVKLNGKSTRFMIDTGASMYVIEFKYLQDLFDGAPPLEYNCPSMAVQTVSGQHLPIIGSVKVTLHLAGEEYPCELKVIRGLSCDAVLGRDFLYDTGASIHLKTNTLELDDKSTYEAAIPTRVTEHFLQVRLVCLKSPHTWRNAISLKATHRGTTLSRHVRKRWPRPTRMKIYTQWGSYCKGRGTTGTPFSYFRQSTQRGGPRQHRR